MGHREPFMLPNVLRRQALLWINTEAILDKGNRGFYFVFVKSD